MAVELVTSTEADLPLIDQWCQEPPYRERCIYDIAFLTASLGSLLAFKLCDQDGIVLFCRIEEDATNEELCRFHILFAPLNIVSKIRVAKVLLKATKVVFEHFRAEGYSGIIFDSVSNDLIKFLSRSGFKSVEGTNDYLLQFSPATATNPPVLAQILTTIS
jgi:hypothetical protein